MRVLVESERALVVEAPGPFSKYFLLFLVLPAILIHGVIFFPSFRLLLERSREFSAFAFLIISLCAYALLAYLVMGPLHDKVTVTFHGLKMVILVETALPFGITLKRTIPFQNFKHLEVSAPENQGVCRVRMNDGTEKLLFRIRKGDNFAPIQRLEMVVRKKVMTIH